MSRINDKMYKKIKTFLIDYIGVDEDDFYFDGDNYIHERTYYLQDGYGNYIQEGDSIDVFDWIFDLFKSSMASEAINIKGYIKDYDINDDEYEEYFNKKIKDYGCPKGYLSLSKNNKINFIIDYLSNSEY